MTLLTRDSLTADERAVYDTMFPPEQAAARPLNSKDWGYVILRPRASMPACVCFIPEDVTAGFCYPLTQTAGTDADDGYDMTDVYGLNDGQIEAVIMAALNQL